MGPLKQVITIIAAVSALGALNCGKEPLLTNLETNQLMVVLKGTYESNSPMDWAMPTACQNSSLRTDGTMACDTYTAGHLSQVQDDSVVICDGRDSGIAYGKDDSNPSVFMIDIAEMVLMDYKSTKHKFSNYRQTYAFGLGDGDPMFNGAGYLLDNDDVPSKAYAALGIYVRKMLLNGARNYAPDKDGWRSSPIWDVFAENELPSYNFNKYQMHSYYDTLRYESSFFNRVYPIIIPISDMKGMIFSDKFPVTVLEVRFVVKNFIKKYEISTVSGGINNAIHFYGFSDWLQDVQADDTVIGGNILIVARWYVPGLTGKITGTNGGANDAHVIAIPHDPSGLNINNYTIPYDPYTVPPKPSGTLRQNNPANFPRKSPFALGMSIQNMLDHYLKNEKYKYDWNIKLATFNTERDNWNIANPGDVQTHMGYYEKLWTTFSREVGGFKVPELAVFIPVGGQYTIENVMPGSYDVYMSNRAPVYGELYHNGEFVFQGTVNVSPGSTITVP